MRLTKPLPAAPSAAVAKTPPARRSIARTRALYPERVLDRPAKECTSDRPAAERPRETGPLLKKALRDWHSDDQPRERLMQHGPEALATSELIAILLRTGTKRHSAIDVAQDLLQRCGGQLRTLSQMDHKTLAETHGMGKVKAVTLLAALELGRRRASESDVERPKVVGAARAYDLLAPVLRDLTHEECWVLLLNSASRLIARERISVGGLDGTIVDVRKVMASALRNQAAAFILAHNHPSQSPTPSREDIALTRRLKEAGALMNVPLRDHLIVAGRRYYSFLESKRL